MYHIFYSRKSERTDGRTGCNTWCGPLWKAA